MAAKTFLGRAGNQNLTDFPRFWNSRCNLASPPKTGLDQTSPIENWVWSNPMLTWYVTLESLGSPELSMLCHLGLELSLVGAFIRHVCMVNWGCDLHYNTPATPERVVITWYNITSSPQTMFFFCKFYPHAHRENFLCTFILIRAHRRKLPCMSLILNLLRSCLFIL